MNLDKTRWSEMNPVKTRQEGIKRDRPDKDDGARENVKMDMRKENV